MNEKKLYTIFIIFVIVLIIGSFLGGYFISRGRSNSEIRDAQNTVDTLTKKVEKLDNDLEIAEQEISTLRELQSADRKTIEGLYQSNRTIAELVGKQGNIINELRNESTGIEESSSTIEIGLRDAIRSVDEIIYYIQMGED